MSENNCVENDKKKIYIVMTQTGTLLSRVLKLLSKDTYNHASIALDDKLEEMYSFGRLNAYNPFVGGFVKESPNYGTFKRFSNTDAMIVTLEITCEQYENVKKMLSLMYLEKEKYHYNYKGLFAAFFVKQIKKINRFYCSEFVKHVLTENGIVSESVFREITHPADFCDIPACKMVYVGKLRRYALSVKETIDTLKADVTSNGNKKLVNQGNNNG